MRIYLPEISWHDRDPIYSCAFHPVDVFKFATCGVSKQIRIWRITGSDKSQVRPNIEFLSEISWHTRTINVIRFSNTTGELLASGGDDAVICISRMITYPIDDRISLSSASTRDCCIENWQLVKTLRGHLEDVLDVTWSSDNQLLFSASVDNAFIIWDVSKGLKLSLVNEGQGFVQGISVDPSSNYICTLSSDSVLRFYNRNTMKKILKVSKLVHGCSLRNPHGPPTENVKLKPMKLFFEKEYGFFMRRLCFSFDGQFLFVTGSHFNDNDCQQSGNFSTKMAVSVFHQSCFKTPIAFLCTGQESTVSVAVFPYPLHHRQKQADPTIGGFASSLSIPYRLVVAVLTEKSIFLYDSHQEKPFGRIFDIHYASLTDLCWSNDGRVLAASSIDGYVTFVLFDSDEFGERFTVPDSNCESMMDIEPTFCSGKKTEFNFKKFGKSQGDLDMDQITSIAPASSSSMVDLLPVKPDDVSIALSHQMEESMDITDV